MSRRTMNYVAAVAAATTVMATSMGAAGARESRAKAVKPFINNVIVTQKSIGGFALGESPSAVRRHFGRKDCTSYCQYAGSGYTAQVQFGSKSSGAKPTLDFISLISSSGKDAAMKVRTASGVRLGSTYAQAKKGLAHAKYTGNKQSGYFFIGKGTLHSTDTTVYITKGVVNLINVQRIDQEG